VCISTVIKRFENPFVKIRKSWYKYNVYDKHNKVESKISKEAEGPYNYRKHMLISYLEGFDGVHHLLGQDGAISNLRWIVEVVAV